MRVLVLLLGAATFSSVGTRDIIRLPVHFEPNVGQASDDVRYVGRYAEGAVLLKDRQVVFLGKQDAIGLWFPGAVRNPRLLASGKIAGRSGYFIERFRLPKNLVARQYQRVTYRHLYPGISLVFRGNSTELEYDFVVSPRANARRIRLAFDGIKRLEVSASGDLILHTPGGELRHRRPSGFQEISGKRQAVEIAYRVIGKRQVTFAIAGYDDSAPLVIDPKVAWTSAPIRGTIKALAVDSASNVYLAGYTPSGRGVCATERLFGGLSSTIPCNDGFVAKLDPTGTRVIYNTVLGGLSEDEAASIAVDGAGNAYVLGSTFSADFPVSSNAAQSRYAGPEPKGYGFTPLSTGGDLFIVKLDTAGKVVYSTFLGGSEDESAARIRIDAEGNAYISGRTYVSGGTVSPNFPITPGAYISSVQFGGGIVAKINPTGTRVLWATYVRSGLNSAVIYLDRNGGTVYAVVGSAVVKLNRDGGFAGGFDVANDSESAADLAVDSQANMWVVGASRFGVALIAKVRPDGTLTFDTLFGAGGSGAYTVAVDGIDRAFVAGAATAGVPVTPDALLSTPPRDPGFLVVFNPDGTVAYASYAPARILALALGSSGEVYTTDGISVTKMEVIPTALPSLSYLVNAASGSSGYSAPGEIVTVFGSALGPQRGTDLQLDSEGRVATLLAGTRVLFNGIPAPLLYVSDRQINTVIPFGLPVGKRALVQVEAGGQKSAPLTIEIEPRAPEIFTGSRTGQAAALNEDGTPNSADNPAPRGSVISLFATGCGELNPFLVDAQLGPIPPSLLAVPVQVLFGGIPGEVLFAGSAPGLIAGMIQINVRVPESLLLGPEVDAVGVTLVVGTSTSQATTIVSVR